MTFIKVEPILNIGWTKIRLLFFFDGFFAKWVFDPVKNCRLLVRNLLSREMNCVLFLETKWDVRRIQVANSLLDQEYEDMLKS